jgi:hypothetical protein
MPIIRNSTSGAAIIALGKETRRFPLSVAAGTTSAQAGADLQVNNLNHVTYYVFLSAGPAGCTFTPYFAADNQVVAGVAAPRWFPVAVPQLLIVGTPLIISVRLVTNMVSGTITVPGGGAGATADLIISAGG